MTGPEDKLTRDQSVFQLPLATHKSQVEPATSSSDRAFRNEAESVEKISCGAERS